MQITSPTVFLFVILSVASTAHAQNRGGAINSPMQGAGGGRPQPTITYDGAVLPGQKGPRQSEHRGSVSTPVYGGKGFGVTASLSAGQTNFGDPITLDTGKNIPTTLHRNEFGIQYSRFTENQRNFRARVAVGYAGDDHTTSKDLTFTVNASYGYPAESGSGSWMLMVYASNNSPLINYLPIPGFAYFYKTPTFTGMFGLPLLSMQWMPQDPWVFSLSVFGPIVQSEVAYGMRDVFQTFLSLGMHRQSYILSDRQEERDRLTLSETRATTGFRLPLNQILQMELQGGRSFARSAYIGKGFLNKDRGRTNLEPDWFIAWSLRAAF